MKRCVTRKTALRMYTKPIQAQKLNEIKKVRTPTSTRPGLDVLRAKRREVETSFTSGSHQDSRGR